jgi:transposase
VATLTGISGSFKMEWVAALSRNTQSTSTYGDAMRYQFRQAGFTIHQASAKRVHDAKEIYDGVPSLHDAKAAWLIAQLYQDGLTKPWHELGDKERELNA